MGPNAPVGFGVPKRDMPDLAPEQRARQQIDAQLVACGWVVQDYKAVDFSAGPGIAQREVPLTPAQCDYLLLVDRNAANVSSIAKPRSHLEGLLRSERQLLANPPSNDSDWFRKDDDVRWQFGVLPKSNANFDWVQHFIQQLVPKGMAGFVLANCRMSSNWSGEGEIRRALIEADLVECMVALPGKLFYSTLIPKMIQ